MLIAKTYSSVFKSKKTRDAKSIFIRVFSLQQGRPISTQALSHSCHLFTLFFVQVMVFCNITWVPLIQIVFIDAHIFS